MTINLFAAMLIFLFLPTYMCEFSTLFNRALDDATLCLSAFTDGRAAAHRLFKTIERKPNIDSDAAAGMVLELRRHQG